MSPVEIAPTSSTHLGIVVDEVGRAAVAAVRDHGVYWVLVTSDPHGCLDIELGMATNDWTAQTAVMPLMDPVRKRFMDEVSLDYAFSSFADGISMPARAASTFLWMAQ